MIPPIAIDGSIVTIRRFPSTPLTLDALVEMKSCTSQHRDTLIDMISDRQNVVIAGGTGTGKTTLLAACMRQCDDAERLITIEDAAELPITHAHRVRLEARVAAAGGPQAVTIRDLVRNALRMRPDRIIVGEVRGGEAFDLVQALNTGHRGCWSTVHANSADDALDRLESMVLLAETGLPHVVVRTQIRRAIDCIVFLERTSTGARRVAEIRTVDATS